MNLTQVKCLNCGAKINVDYDTNTGVCVYCTSEYITEDLIKSSAQDINSTAPNFIKTVYGNEQLNLSELLRNSAVFLQLNEFKKAEENFNKAIDQNPADWRGWFGIVKCKTQNFNDLEDKTHLEYLRKSITVANDKQVEIISKLYSTYLVAKYNLSKTNIIYNTPQTNEASNNESSSKAMHFPKQDSSTLNVKTGKKKKKVFKKLFILLCLLTICVVGIFGAEIVPYYDNYTYTATYKLDGNVSLTEYKGSSINLFLPSMMKNKTLTTIGKKVFKNNKNLKTIILPKTITKINSEAFYNCINLESITLYSVSPPVIGENIINFKYSTTCKIYVPDSSVARYKNDWSEYRTIIYPMSSKI